MKDLNPNYGWRLFVFAVVMFGVTVAVEAPKNMLIVGYLFLIFWVTIWIDYKGAK